MAQSSRTAVQRCDTSINMIEAGIAKTIPTNTKMASMVFPSKGKLPQEPDGQNVFVPVHGSYPKKDHPICAFFRDLFLVTPTRC
jgi:hypothetical protein